MPALLTRFWFSLRFALLTATVLLVLGLNQRAVSTLRLPAGKGETRLAAPPKATVVKQKVLFEATGTLKHFVAPLGTALAAAAGPGHHLAAHAAPAAGRAAPAGGHPRRRGIPRPAAGRGPLAAGPLVLMKNEE